MTRPLASTWARLANWLACTKLSLCMQAELFSLRYRHRWVLDEINWLDEDEAMLPIKRRVCQRELRRIELRMLRLKSESAVLKSGA